MAVTSDFSPVQVTLASGADVVAVNTLVLEPSHLAVYRTRAGVTDRLVLNSGYTVAGAGETNGVQLTMVGQAAGDIITIYRDMPFLQSTVLRDGAVRSGPLDERNLDLRTMEAQQVRSETARAIRFPQGEPLSTVSELPAANDRKGKALGFSAADGSAQIIDLPSVTYEGGRLVEVADISTLTATATAKEVNQTIYVRGYTTSGDGGGGQFVVTAGTWASGDLIPGIRVNLSNGTHKAERVIGHRVYPEMCGAKGDGVTDDTVALKWWGKAAEVYGCILALTPGNKYKVNRATAGGFTSYRRFDQVRNDYLVRLQPGAVFDLSGGQILVSGALTQAEGQALTVGDADAANGLPVWTHLLEFAHDATSGQLPVGRGCYVEMQDADKASKLFKVMEVFVLQKDEDQNRRDNEYGDGISYAPGSGQGTEPLRNALRNVTLLANNIFQVTTGTAPADGTKVVMGADLPFFAFEAYSASVDYSARASDTLVHSGANLYYGSPAAGTALSNVAWTLVSRKDLLNVHQACPAPRNVVLFVDRTGLPSNQFRLRYRQSAAWSDKWGNKEFVTFDHSATWGSVHFAEWQPDGWFYGLDVSGFTSNGARIIVNVAAHVGPKNDLFRARYPITNCRVSDCLAIQAGSFVAQFVGVKGGVIEQVVGLDVSEQVTNVSDCADIVVRANASLWRGDVSGKGYPNPYKTRFGEGHYTNSINLQNAISKDMRNIRIEGGNIQGRLGLSSSFRSGRTCITEWDGIHFTDLEFADGDQAWANTGAGLCYVTNVTADKTTFRRRTNDVDYWLAYNTEEGVYVDGSLDRYGTGAGKLVVGRRYRIIATDGTLNLSNVGAANNNVGTEFVATGTTPTAWGTGMVLDLGILTGGAVTSGNYYNIVANTGADFTGVGAPANTVGTIFEATSSGTPTWGSAGQLLEIKSPNWGTGTGLNLIDMGRVDLGRVVINNCPARALWVARCEEFIFESITVDCADTVGWDADVPQLEAEGSIAVEIVDVGRVNGDKIYVRSGADKGLLIRQCSGNVDMVEVDLTPTRAASHSSATRKCLELGQSADLVIRRAKTTGGADALSIDNTDIGSITTPRVRVDLLETNNPTSRHISFVNNAINTEGFQIGEHKRVGDFPSSLLYGSNVFYGFERGTGATLTTATPSVTHQVHPVSSAAAINITSLQPAQEGAEVALFKVNAGETVNVRPISWTDVTTDAPFATAETAGAGVQLSTSPWRKLVVADVVVTISGGQCEIDRGGSNAAPRFHIYEDVTTVIGRLYRITMVVDSTSGNGNELSRISYQLDVAGGGPIVDVDTAAAATGTFVTTFTATATTTRIGASIAGDVNGVITLDSLTCEQAAADSNILLKDGNDRALNVGGLLKLRHLLGFWREVE